MRSAGLGHVITSSIKDDGRGDTDPDAGEDIRRPVDPRPYAAVGRDDGQWQQ
jgi:hypothetical protein